MTNRPKQIGTAAETAVLRAARDAGWHHADRLTLTGAQDRGDIRLTRDLVGGIILEVKGGNIARDASDAQIEAWLDETERERANAGADHGFLVTQRRGVGAPNAHRWWAWGRLGGLLRLLGDHRIGHGGPIVRLLYGDLLGLLDGWGYRDAAETSRATAAHDGEDS